MSLERELERAAAMASSHARAGEQVAAVMPAEPVPGMRLYLAAFESRGDLGYLLLDASGEPVRDRRVVRDAVTVIALSERAEEVSSAVAADAIADRFDRLVERLAGADADAAAAAGGVAQAARRVSGVTGGARVATPGYLDQLGAAATELGAAMDAYAEHAERLGRAGAGGGRDAELAEAAWSALAEAAAAGDPAGFAQAITAAADAIEALADDVVARYRLSL
jgi:hypothetical protein